MGSKIVRTISLYTNPLKVLSWPLKRGLLPKIQANLGVLRRYALVRNV